MIEPRGTNSDRVRFDISLYFTTTREKASSYHFETIFKTKKCARNDWIVVKITDTSTYWNWKSVRKWSFPFAYSNRVDEDRRPWHTWPLHDTANVMWDSCQTNGQLGFPIDKWRFDKPDPHCSVVWSYLKVIFLLIFKLKIEFIFKSQLSCERVKKVKKANDRKQENVEVQKDRVLLLYKIGLQQGTSLLLVAEWIRNEEVNSMKHFSKANQRTSRIQL